MNNQKKLKGNLILEHTVMMDLLRKRGFLMKYSKCILYRMGKSYKSISISDHFNFVSLYMENHRLVKEFNPSFGLSGFFSQMTCTSKSLKQQASSNFP